MQKNNIFIKTALAIIAAVLTTGCIFEKMDMPEDLQDVMILLNVSTDGMQTKATPDESESAINTLHIYAFWNGTPAGYIVRQATQQDEHFLMDLQLPAMVSGGTDEQNTHSVEFYLVANAASMTYENNPVSLSENTTKAELEALKFTGIAQNSPLPLYCKKTEQLNVAAYTSNEADGHKGHMLLNQKASFSLSRSLAKISVYGAKPEGVSTSPRILGVNMLQGGTREYSYLFEQTDDVLNAVPSRANNHMLLSTPVQVGEINGAVGDPASYTEVMTTPFYLPEVTYGSDSWNVSSGNERAVVLHIEYALSDGGDSRSALVYMPRIYRNHHYKVLCLISSIDEGQIIINLEVADWEDHTINNFVFDYPTHSYLRASVPTSDAEVAQKPTSAATMSETSSFVGYFQMTAPDSDKWRPTLLGNHASEADVKVYERSSGNTYTEVPQDMWPMSASSSWYKIEVVPKTGFTIGETVNLAITYSTTVGFTTSEYLLINGSSGEYYWPGSSDANFVTITMVNN